METKICFKCGQEKPIDEFYVHPRMADGHLNKCKACAKQDVRANYRSRRAQYSLYEKKRNRTAKRRAQKLRYQRKRRSQHPQKYKARQKLGNALRDHRLYRRPCEVCGDPEAEAHHPDYSRPFEVRWLCFKHHRELHGQVVQSAGCP